MTLGGRHFVTSVVCLLLLQLVCPDSISAPKVGVLWQVASPVDTSLFEGLRELGYTPGRDILIDWRITDTSSEKIRSLALDLVRTNSDIIVTGGTVVTRETLAVNKQIPVVFVAGDPVGTGFVKSLAQPAGNATGVSSGPTDLTGKRLELLQILTPHARHIGYLRNPSNPAQDLSFQEVLRVAKALRIQIEPLSAADSRDLVQVLSNLSSRRLDAILVSGEITFFKERTMIAAAIRQAKLPAMFALPEYHDVGVLMSYGPSAKDAMRRVAGYVDKILKGAKPATLPVEQISKFDFVIDLRVAREMGIKVPEQLLLRADEVIR